MNRFCLKPRLGNSICVVAVLKLIGIDTVADGVRTIRQASVGNDDRYTRLSDRQHKRARIDRLRNSQIDCTRDAQAIGCYCRRTVGYGCHDAAAIYCRDRRVTRFPVDVKAWRYGKLNGTTRFERRDISRRTYREGRRKRDDGGVRLGRLCDDFVNSNAVLVVSPSTAAIYCVPAETK